MKSEEVVIVDDLGDVEMQDIETLPPPGRNLLLNLPPEILQLVLFHADTGALLASLTSCKKVFDAAKAKHVVLQHMNRMPGLRLGLADLDSKTLFDTFRQRAAKSLYAAGVLGHLTVYASSDDCISMKTSALFQGKPTLLATAHGHGEVRIYELTEKLDAEFQRPYQMDVLRMAFSNDRDLAVLCRPMQPKVEATPFTDSNDQSPKVTMHTLKLVTFHRCHAKTKGHFYASDQQEIRDITYFPNQEPVGLALASKGNACITWRDRGIVESTSVALYGRDAKLMEAQDYDPSPQCLIYTDPNNRTDTAPPRQIFAASFSTSDRVLNFHRPGSPIHNWFTHSTNPSSTTSGPIHTNTAYITLSPSLIPSIFKVAIPFHAHHTPSISVTYSAAPMCRTSYLALGECTDSDFALSAGGPNSSNVFIVHGEIDTAPTACSHTPSLDAGRRNDDWKALALLSGWRHGTSSLGTVVAISSKGSHVAAATWDRVLVWSLDADLLHQGALEHYFPACDWNQKKGLGRLRPVRVRSAGVVYAMCWVGECVLYAVTDGGLVRWDVGPRADGGKEELRLEYDAWKETAVAAPLVGGGR
ncbi:MAG: hypothetical protein Q9195_003976 [Heterodermia aff. obscurata]